MVVLKCLRCQHSEGPNRSWWPCPVPLWFPLPTPQPRTPHQPIRAISPCPGSPAWHSSTCVWPSALFADFIAWPQTSLVTMVSFSNHGVVSDPSYPHWAWPWLVFQAWPQTSLGWTRTGDCHRLPPTCPASSLRVVEWVPTVETLPCQLTQGAPQGSQGGHWPHYTLTRWTVA